MKRMLMTLTLVAFLGMAAVAFAAGGQAPGIPAGFVVQKRPVLVGTFLFDPHQGSFFDFGASIQVPAVTPAAKQGSAIFVNRQHSATFLFNIPEGTALACGCDPTLTRLRFLEGPVTNLVPQETLNQVLAQLRVTPPDNGSLIITSILGRRCLKDPNLDPTNVDPITNHIISIDPLQPTCAVETSKFFPGDANPTGNPGAGIFVLEVLMQFLVPGP